MPSSASRQRAFTPPSLLLAVVLFSASAAPAAAQETPTEREAAREVLQKMAALEQSLDVPAMVAKLSAANAQRDAVAARAKALMDTELLALSDDICTHPEIGYKETRSVQKLAEALRKHDFDVMIGAGTLETAFVATFKGNNGTPNLGVIVEYDALRGTQGAFHGDQPARRDRSGSRPLSRWQSS